MSDHGNSYTFGIIILAIAITLSSCCEENVEWTCKSGDCLAAEKACDGISDCPDGSDETADTCLQTVCAPFSFRCAYGACIPRGSQCNGKLECVDGSDEADGLCKPDVISSNTICSNQEFQCDSGTCISQGDACNGQPNCEDNSDETAKACSATFCPAPYFRCGYGACINLDKKCDGKVDCNDRSDEISCENNPAEWTTKPPVLIETTSPVTKAPFTIPPTVPVSASKTSCTVPAIKNSKLVYAHDPSQELHSGDEVPSGLEINYMCRRSYYREGLSSNVCVNGKWNNQLHPICTRYCESNVLNGVTFRAVCTYENVVVDCSNRIKPGTIVQTRCRTKYRIPDHNPPQRLLCEEDGGWDYWPSRCEQVCGEILIESVPFSVHGMVTNITAVPWHVAIYSKLSTAYRHNCGGTILNAKVVISAAHCFWDSANEKLYNKNLFLVAAGKSFRDYAEVEPRAPQMRNISLIVVPDEFNGGANNFKADIALLILTEPLQFTTFVAPICIEWKSAAAKTLPDDTYGQTAGWGKDETGTFSNDLRTTFVPMSSYGVCQKAAGPDLANTITEDKFCVLNKYNQNVCEGDSGGGFVVKKLNGGKNLFYLWGVVSNGVPSSVTCSDYKFVNYLNIQHYEDFVSTYEAKNRPR